MVTAATREMKKGEVMSAKLMNLSDVIGQTNIVRWFESCIKRDHLPQVIMLQGPTGIGKTSIAKIVACEIACMNSPERLEECKKAVILENKSTDCVKLYNMSNLKSQEKVNEVKSDLNIGFSSTGRKVIIMDEAHGMSEEAQDSLLTTFESLQSQVYVIVCSTELESFREAFVGRCVLRRMMNLSQSEMRILLTRRIKENGLKFELSMDMVISLISMYTGREPRKALNLLDSFEENSTVTVSELETFFNVFEGKQVIALIDYLYGGDVIAGLDFISGLEIGPTFQKTLLEALKVAQDGQSNLIDQNGTLHLRQVVGRSGLDRLLGFVIDCTTRSRLTKNLVSGFFLKWCSRSDILSTPPVRKTPEQVQLNDLAIMGEMMERSEVQQFNTEASRGLTLEQMMADGELIE